MKAAGQLHHHRAPTIISVALACLVLTISAACSGAQRPQPPEVTPVSLLSTTTTPPAIQQSASFAQCSRHPVPLGLSQVAAPGSALSLEVGAGVPPATLTDLAQLLCAARIDQGDSGPLAVHIFAATDDFVAAYSLLYPGSADHIRSLITQGLRAETVRGHIWFTPNVLSGPGPSLAETTSHEYFHTVQTFLIAHSPYFVPVWLVEGTALFLGYTQAQAYGLDNIAHFRAGELSVARQTPQPLAAFEQPAAGAPSAQIYALGFLAAEYLTKTYGDATVRHDLWSAMSSAPDWKSAFASVFSTGVDQFYASFEAYRQTQL